MIDIRNTFIDKYKIRKIDANRRPTVLNDAQKKQILDEWKKRFHASAFQMELQFRDSWEPKEQGKCKGLELKHRATTLGPWDQKGSGARQPADQIGPNKALVRTRKHSRWCLHLQRDFGDKAIAEVILFTGRFDAEFLRKYMAETGGVHERMSNIPQ